MQFFHWQESNNSLLHELHLVALLLLVGTANMGQLDPLDRPSSGAMFKIMTTRFCGQSWKAITLTQPMVNSVTASFSVGKRTSVLLGQVDNVIISLSCSQPLADADPSYLMW